MIADYACKNNDFSKAVSAYKNALKVDENSFQAHVGLVRLLNMAGQPTKARSHLKGIRKKDPDLASLVEDVLTGL